MNTKAWKIGSDMKERIYSFLNIHDWLKRIHSGVIFSRIAGFLAVVALFATLSSDKIVETEYSVIGQATIYGRAIALVLLMTFMFLAMIYIDNVRMGKEFLNQKIKELREGFGLSDDETLSEYSVTGHLMKFATEVLREEEYFKKIRKDMSCSSDTVGYALKDLNTAKKKFELAHTNCVFLGLDINKRDLFASARKQLDKE